MRFLTKKCIKMKLKPILYLFVLFLGFGITGCSDDEIDTEKPTMTVYSPGAEQVFRPGQNLNFIAEFSDNVGLNAFKIDIHYGGDHDHKKHEEEDEKWHYVHTAELSGRSEEVSMEIDIPGEIKTGEYHFMIFLTDVSGNESIAAITINIEH